MVDDKRSSLFYQFNKNSFIMPVPVQNVFVFHLTNKYELA